MILINILAATYEAYKVDLDSQYVIPIFYVVPLLLGYMLRKYSPKLIGPIIGIIFTVSAAYLAYTLYLDYPIWKYAMPVVAVLGGLSGMSGWVRFILKKIKNIGDDDKILG